MPDKTLKEKVDLAKKCLDEQLDSLEQHKYGVVVVRKALTALEEENMMLRGSVKGLEDLLQRLEDEGRILQEAPDGK